MFTQLGGLMAERVTDLRDIRDRVIAELTGLPEPGVPVPDVPSILCAEDLAPADTAGLDPSLVVALATTLGGPTSHTAIIARQLGIPCVVGRRRPGRGARGHDGPGRRRRSGTVTVAPDAAAAAEAVARGAAAKPTPPSSWTGPGATADGHAGRDPRQRPGRRRGAFGRRDARRGRRPVPHRTVLPQPRHRTHASTSRPQIYGEVLDAFAGRKVVIRTLDAGSDKPLKFAGHPDEANPALGVRGIRIATGQSRAC